MKKCSKCGEIKPLNAFYRDKTKRDGLYSQCKSCCTEYHQKYYQEHREQLVEYQRKHCEQTAKCHRDYYNTVNGHLRYIFNAAKQRCNNPKNKAYKNYGGRGITFLFKSFEEFYNYIVNELQVDPRGLQIDRINNDGHYEKGNIRFVTSAENNRNKRQYKLRG